MHSNGQICLEIHISSLADLLQNGLRNLPMKLFISLILWCILLVICWPVAIILLVLFPLAWLLLLPFKIVGLSIELVFKLISAILLFPFRMFSKT